MFRTTLPRLPSSTSPFGLSRLTRPTESPGPPPPWTPLSCLSRGLAAPQPCSPTSSLMEAALEQQA
eukprot:2747561-Alexandrium_andersonii.AAC.1